MDVDLDHSRSGMAGRLQGFLEEMFGRAASPPGKPKVDGIPVESRARYKYRRFLVVTIIVAPLPLILTGQRSARRRKRLDAPAFVSALLCRFTQPDSALRVRSLRSRIPPGLPPTTRLRFAFGRVPACFGLPQSRDGAEGDNEMFNNVTLIGYLGSDAESRKTRNNAT